MQPSIPCSSSVSVFFIERMASIYSLKCAGPFSFVVPLLSLAVIHCHLLSFVVTLCVTRCITRCTTCCHSLSLVVIRCTTRCHSLYHSLSFVVTRCSTRLSFYKWSIKTLSNEWIGEVRNSIRDIKAKTDVHCEQVNNKKRLWDELETKNTIIKLLIDNSKQLAHSIGKSNTTEPLFQTPDFSENSNFILPKKNMHTKNLTINENQQIHYHQIVISYWNLLLKILN